MKDPLLVRNDDPPAPLPSVEFPRRGIDPGPVNPTPPAAAAPVAMATPSRSFAPPSPAFGPAFTQALLIVCILMLGIIIGMKLSDYFHARDIEQRELALYRAAQPRQDSPSPPSPGVPQVSGPSVSLPAVPQAQPAPEPTPPPPATPDYSDQLAALQQERDLMRQRFESLSGPAGTAPAPVPGAPAAPESFLPPAGSPSSSSESRTPAYLPPRTTLTPAQQRIREAPSLGKVMEYDTDWHFVVISCGANHNLTQSQQLAIRRGHEILGLVRLDEVLPDESIANLEGAWKVDAQAPKPQVGDDVLTYPPF